MNCRSQLGAALESKSGGVEHCVERSNTERIVVNIAFDDPFPSYGAALPVFVTA